MVCKQLPNVSTGQEAFQMAERNQHCFMNFRYAFGQIKRIILTILFVLFRIRFMDINFNTITYVLTHSLH